MTLDDRITEYIDYGVHGGDFWHDKAIAIIDELQAEIQTMLAAAKEATAKVPEGGCKIILDDWDLKSLKQLKKAIAACEEKP